jgi:hypothetical protein
LCHDAQHDTGVGIVKHIRWVPTPSFPTLGETMVIIDQLIQDIYKAIDKFERETGLVISSIEQKHQVVDGNAIVYHRDMKLGAVKNK